MKKSSSFINNFQQQEKIIEPLLIVYIHVQNTCLIFIVIANKTERFIKFVVCWHVALKIIKTE